MTQTRAMRAINCQITNEDEIRNILDSCERCRLGFSENGMPYIVPMNYGYTYENGVITLFFHSSGEGRKVEIIKQNPVVCFEIDYDTKLNPDDNPDRHAVMWESLIGTGTAQIVTNLDEKRRMLGNMMRKFRGYNPHYRPTPLTESRVIDVLMIKLVLDEFKAKRVFHR